MNWAAGEQPGQTSTVQVPDQVSHCARAKTYSLRDMPQSLPAEVDEVRHMEMGATPATDRGFAGVRCRQHCNAVQQTIQADKSAQCKTCVVAASWHHKTDGGGQPAFVLFAAASQLLLLPSHVTAEHGSRHCMRTKRVPISRRTANGA